MPCIFAYLEHKGGVVSEGAAELLAAARRIDSNAAPTAILIGYGAGLDAACSNQAPQCW
jgi:electron transfer flavoprotein alpha subunit